MVALKKALDEETASVGGHGGAVDGSKTAKYSLRPEDAVRTVIII